MRPYHHRRISLLLVFTLLLTTLTATGSKAGRPDARSAPAKAAGSSPHTHPLTAGDDDAPAQAANPIDESQFFVRRHYLDFLNREPNAAGLAFWVNEIESCGSNAQCRELKRINVSTAFFLSIEYQNTGYLAYRFYRASS
jgi:hypothetical protein